VNADPDSPYYGKRLLYSPLYKTSISASVGAPDVWEISLAFRQVSERFVTELNTVWLDPYYLLDVKVRWKFLFVSAANLLDADYEESQGYPMPGRSFKGGVDFEF
jgi:outer membrane cobalamin receptor